MMAAAGCTRSVTRGNRGRRHSGHSRVWFNKNEGNEKGVRSGFIKATLGGDGEMRKVMLVTLPVYSKEKENGKGVLHLWLTDNTHIVDIGPVSEKDEDVTASFLLYKSAESKDKNDELIALYEKKGNGDTPSHDMVSVLLTEQLQRVKEVLKMWKKVDERVSQLCTTLIARKITSTESACNTAMPVDGLVGFLSDNFSENTWRDEYLGVNATVNNDSGAKKADNGVQFTGRGAGAQWPVGSQGENQLYHFANYNFTLVATVSIDGEPTEGNIPVMGVKRMKGDSEDTVLLGLSYNKEKKWILLCGGGQNKEHSRDWDPETTKKDHVVILLRNGNQLAAYVDGQPVGDAQCKLETTDSKEISHFYIGGDGDKTRNQGDVSVTVTNVLLYNRPLNEAEITALNPNKAPTTPQMNSLTQGTSNERSGGRQEEQESLEERGSGGASTTVVSTVTTSSAEEESVIQVTSGTSSGGNKTMAAASSPDDQTVEAEARKTVQGDGSPQTPVDNPDAAAKKAPNAEAVGQDGPPVNPEVGASSGENGEPTEGTDGQEEEVQPQERELNAAALNSSLGNVSQGNNSDAWTVRGSGLLPSLLLLLLGLWGFAAL
ncbi:trans-sialidase [Trypanosoma cruzi Dm28c]|uniref:Trans-sialidase n=1 Tax=Trypanosoma cruzi Dm28c TaxID=1416333 RepID=V5A338_TRYCR|nr:trans-sialidase [Trypanosoma cruzi Dm28c]